MTTDARESNRTRGEKKTDLVSFRAQLRDKGFGLSLPDRYCRAVLDGSLFRPKNLPLALAATQLALEQNPTTLRGLLYRVVSASQQLLPSTDKKHYNRLGRLLTALREAGVVPFEWIVDNVRSTEKPSSWAGLEDFAETVRRAYRKDFWASLPEYVHVIVEKDAIAGVLSPVTREYDVRLSPIRGYVSLSFAHEIAATWNRVNKPVRAYYFGDYDASGFDLERDARAKLARYCKRPFSWVRLGVNADDFDAFNLIPLAVKDQDRRAKKFREVHGDRCAELDALPATELRRRAEEAILSHIDPARWEWLQEVERLERESIAQIATNWSAGKGVAR